MRPDIKSLRNSMKIYGNEGKKMTKRIMVVDDDADIRFTIEQAMEFYNDDYEVILATDGKHCFQLLEEGKKPDLILLDLMMPGMDGFSVFDKLKARQSPYSSIPVVFLTAKKDNDSVDIGKLFGEDFIEKPFEFDDLIQRVEKILNKNDNDEIDS